MSSDLLCWDIPDPNKMLIYIYRTPEDCTLGRPAMTISAYDVIESLGRNKVLKHVKECDNSPWLHRWQKEKHEALIDLLKND